MRRLEKAAERIANEAVELSRQHSVGVGEPAQVKKEVRPLFEALGIPSRLRARDALEVPKIPLARLS